MTNQFRVVATLVGLLVLSTGCESVSAVEVGADRYLIPNGSLEAPAEGGKAPLGFELSGDAVYGMLGDVNDRIGRGVRFFSNFDQNRDQHRAAALTTTVEHLTPAHGRWFRLRIEGLAQDDFAVDKDDLYLDVEFFRDAGSNTLDHTKRLIYPQIVADRTALRDAGTNKNLGLATWRSFDLDFRTPFPEVDTLRLTVGFDHGQGKGTRSEFWINAVRADADSRPEPIISRRPAAGSAAAATMPNRSWPWEAAGITIRPATDRQPPAKFDLTNVRPAVLSGRSARGPVSPTTRPPGCGKGYLDRAGKLVMQDAIRPRQRDDFLHADASGGP